MGCIWRSLSVTLVVSWVFFGTPATAAAGLLDLIWDMSGPQMIGGVVRCRVPVGGGTTKCTAVAFPVFGVKKGETDVMTERKAWLNLESAFYTSTGKNDGDTNYRAWRTEMLAFDPMIEFASVPNGRVRIFHGAGGTFQYLFGPDVPTAFGNAGFKLRLVGVEVGPRWDFAFNVRLYPDGFGADQFGFGPAPVEDRPFEHTLGVSVTWKVRKFWGD